MPAPLLVLTCPIAHRSFDLRTAPERRLRAAVLSGHRKNYGRDRARHSSASRA